MSQYPTDILTLAQSITSRISERMEASSTLGDAATEVIAEALMAEREKAASILERKAVNMWGSPTGDMMARIFIDEAGAIRSGEQP